MSHCTIPKHNNPSHAVVETRSVNDSDVVKSAVRVSFQYIDAQRTLADFNESEKQEVKDFEELQAKTGWRWKQAQVWMVLDYPGSSRLALV